MTGTDETIVRLLARTMPWAFRPEQGTGQEDDK